MKNSLFFIISILLVISCGEPKGGKQATLKVVEELPDSTLLALRFLDEYVFPPKKVFKNTIIGGLSGIDSDNNQYYIISDDTKNPRAYKANIAIKDKTIENVTFTDVVLFDKKKHSFFNENWLDLEGIVVHNNKFIVSSEGSINYSKNPFIFQTDMSGNFEEAFQLPNKFLADSANKPRHNGVFEGFTKSYDAKGYWSALEFPLEEDGEEPIYGTTKSPVRFTYYDAITKKANREFVYELSSLPREKKGSVNLNGLTAILEFKKDHFFVVERTYQNGYVNNENIIRIYETVIDTTSTNTVEESSLAKTDYKAMKKRLLFDFSKVKSKLAKGIIDNIEGITFGPTLKNGNKSLILISDDNFQKYGEQLNQFILLEIIE